MHDPPGDGREGRRRLTDTGTGHRRCLTTPTFEEREALPADLGQAAEALRGSATARRAFGDDAVDHYVAGAAFEWQRFVAQVTEWETVRFKQG